MRHLWAIVAALAVWTVALGSRDEARVNDAAITADALPSLLSDFGFFAGSADRPVRRLIAYSLN